MSNKHSPQELAAALYDAIKAGEKHLQLNFSDWDVNEQVIADKIFTHFPLASLQILCAALEAKGEGWYSDTTRRFLSVHEFAGMNFMNTESALSMAMSRILHSDLTEDEEAFAQRLIKGIRRAVG